MDELEGVPLRSKTLCPECGAGWVGEVTCESNFHQMLFWEDEYPDYGARVHLLAVLWYHLLHRTLFSTRGLTFGLDLLVKFVREGANPEDVRRESRTLVDGGNHDWKIRGVENSYAAYDSPVAWSMTTAEIVRVGHENYCESVKTWAASILEEFQTAGYTLA